MQKDNVAPKCELCNYVYTIEAVEDEPTDKLLTKAFLL